MPKTKILKEKCTTGMILNKDVGRRLGFSRINLAVNQRNHAINELRKSQTNDMGVFVLCSMRYVDSFFLLC
ncbi:hypothetical protein CO058_00405 [candidate division WWE3 bacterium CG_4_9_14_0_2_um_filter_35_11]|uniref:Uncharacterized protein n=1 Tax=candidate division WWE3 bacterium CG_4_9_14_0_2_um_filter_35_11 TaxID=1975077 RepID=A0A2M8EMN9_UNCKA|nr:MAG: hypothetical protein COV25_01645 [candidate division WWE3 bacterium CG10_big_fil_rev_8_21_14_0_10_35_32]PJC24000.1 MAG: hypothetical protein CO058_00405 [candidate division WWE3 bacterium CG_4_9_14_0_2_um_filter_35_11]